jgi:hypothetical protein
VFVGKAAIEILGKKIYLYFLKFWMDLESLGGDCNSITGAGFARGHRLVERADR